MSAKIFGKVWDLNLPHNKLLVLLALADHADHEGNNVFPSLGLVAWKTGYSQQQCRRVMSELEKDGILVAMQRRQGFKTIYRIDVNKGIQKEPYTPSKMSPLPKSTPHPLHSDGGTPYTPSLKKEQEALESSLRTKTRKRSTPPTKSSKTKTTPRTHPLFTIKYPSNIRSYTAKHIEEYHKEHASDMKLLIQAWAGDMYNNLTEFTNKIGHQYIETYMELSRLKIPPTEYTAIATHTKKLEHWKKSIAVTDMLLHVLDYKDASPSVASTQSTNSMTDGKLAHDYEEMFGVKRNF